MTKFESNYNLEERTKNFSRNLIGFLRKCPKDRLALPLAEQCLRAGTSIGANYREANGASSKKDFQNKVFTCKKEAKETLYWLELIGQTLGEEKIKAECRDLWKEAKELTLIFSKIAFSAKS
jgi:four helix bundle protein